MMIYQTKFTRDGGQGGFGWGVSLSADGAYSLIGGGPSAIFNRRYGWSQQAMIPGGGRVVLTSNGDTAFIGSGNNVLLYRRIGNNWYAADELLGSGANPLTFGAGIAVSHNRTTALIGDPNHGNGKGAVWVFVRDPISNKWTEQARLTPSVGGGGFGFSVALSADGKTALVGGIYDGGHIGAVWTFTRSYRWHEIDKMVSPDRSGYFGYNIALTHDGQMALISDSTGFWPFRWTGTGWQSQGKLTGLGTRVALSADGTIAVIGDPVAERAWLWTGTAYELTPPDKIGMGYFGYNVALTPDGNTALIGDFGDNYGKGAAWLFITPLDVSSVSPPSGPTTGGTTVTISGNGFRGARRVRFGAMDAASFTVDSETQITAISPPIIQTIPGITVNVTVTTSVGMSEANLSSRFTYGATAPPPAPPLG
jgi:hypothetical protein